MPDKPLISLKEHNEKTLSAAWGNNARVNVPNGIACPSCGKECVDDDRSIMLMSKPPQYTMRCLTEGCGWRGSRFI